MIAAQATLVLLLSMLLYLGLLQPDAPSPLNEGSVPGSPPPANVPGNHNHGPSNNENDNPPGPGQTASTGQSNQSGAIQPFVPQPGTGPPADIPSGSPGPNDDQYTNSVASLRAKLGLATSSGP